MIMFFTYIIIPKVRSVQVMHSFDNQVDGFPNYVKD